MTFEELEKLVLKQQDEIKALTDKQEYLTQEIALLNTDILNINYLSKLLDVRITNITEDDILTMGADGKWHNIQPSKIGVIGGGGGTGGATKLSELTDVFISGPSEGLTLVYNGLTKKWLNKSSNPGGDGDLTEYLRKEEAKLIYFPIAGGKITGEVIVGGRLNAEENILVKGDITIHSK